MVFKPATLVAALFILCFPMHAGALEYRAFNNPEIVKAIVERDLDYLRLGHQVDVLGKKVYGLEIYSGVAATCTEVSPRKKYILRKLKWKYLSHILERSANGGASRFRTRVFRLLGGAARDATTLVRQAGCEGRTVQRIIAEIGR